MRSGVHGRIPGQLDLDLFDARDGGGDVVHVLLDHRPGRAAHRREAVDQLHLGAVDLDVVEQAELDDVHPELGILDLVERLEDVFLGQCHARVRVLAGQSRTERVRLVPEQAAPLRAVRARRSGCPSTKRTQLHRVHMTSECVRALSARKRTPRRRSPFETPVAATITSPETMSSVEKTRSTSSIPCSRAASISRREVGQSCACTSPPRQRSAPAVSTAWRVPPMPIDEVVVRAADRGRDRGRHGAVLDQLDPGAGGANLLDQVVVAGTVEDDRRHVAGVAAVRLGDRLDVLADRPQQADLPAGARTDGDRPHVHVGQAEELAGLGGDDHRDRTVPAAGDDAAALERVEREVGGHAAGADRLGQLAVAEHHTPAIGSVSSAACIPEYADSSALTWSSRPSQRAPASAARSVARRYVTHRQTPCGSAPSPCCSVRSASSIAISRKFRPVRPGRYLDPVGLGRPRFPGISRLHPSAVPERSGVGVRQDPRLLRRPLAVRAANVRARDRRRWPGARGLRARLLPARAGSLSSR